MLFLPSKEKTSAARQTSRGLTTKFEYTNNSSNYKVNPS